MELDIRLPISFLFTLFGVLLTGWGIISDASIYQKSLGINVNLYWGVALVVFGLLMFALGRRRSSAGKPTPRHG